MIADKGIGTRGSKLCIQICVNDEIGGKGFKARRLMLEEKIGLGPITWISPLWEDNFQEYELNNLPVNYMKATNLECINWETFWKTKQPQWDAIGYTNDSLILVEAKANTKEVIQNRVTSAIEHTRLIVEKEFGSNPLWNNELFQIANRLIFLRNIKHQFEERGIKRNVFLIFVYFINDVTYQPTQKSEWDAFFIENIKSQEVNERKKYPPKDLVGNIKEVFIDVWRDKK